MIFEKVNKMKDYKNYADLGIKNPSTPAAASLASFNDQLTPLDLILTVLFAVTFYGLIFLATI